MLIQTTLPSTCSSLAGRASSAAHEIDDILTHRINDSKAAEFQKLQSLSSRLRTLANDVSQIQGKLSHASPKLTDLLAAHLPECDAAAAVVTKQVMRVGRDTPRQAINLIAILQYESFAESTCNLLFFANQLLQIDSVQDQDSKITQHTQSLIERVTSACKHVTDADDLIFDTSFAAQPPNLLDEDQDRMPPAYDAPPSFEESSSSAGYTKSKLTKPNVANEKSSGRFSSALKAAASVLKSKPEPLVVALCHAASLGDVSQIQALVNQGVNLNGHDDKGQTALICAIFGGQIDAIRVLLEAGADPSVCDSSRKSKPPLFHAIDAGFKEAADLLLKHRASANQKDGMNEPYFAQLILGDASPNWIELLLSHGADPNAKDVQGRPLAILALQSRKKHTDREQVVELLLKYKAKPDAKDLDGTPLVHFCLEQGREALLQKLLSMGADANGRDVSGIPLLLTAIKRRDCALVETLLKRGADANDKDLYGSPVVMSVLCDSKMNTADKETLVKLLLRHGAKGDHKDGWGVTALEHALAPTLKGISPSGKDGKFEIPELLLQRGADPNQVLSKESGDPTVLTYAVDHSLHDLAGLVLRNGANANLPDKKGRLPLLLAVRGGDEEMVALLIKYGADANSQRGMSPLDEAVSCGRNEIAQLLEAHGARPIKG